MALHGNQSKFDRNGDGRLSWGEYSRWYYHKYGHDMEMADRKRTYSVSADDAPDDCKKHTDIIALTERVNKIVSIAGWAVETDDYDSFEGIEAMEPEELKKFFEDASRFYLEFSDAEPEDINSAEHELWHKMDEALIPILDAADCRLHEEKL